MSRRMIVEASGAFTHLAETKATDEAQLQDLVKDYPDLIPVEELGVDGPLLVVGREAWLATGAIDLLLLTPSGDLIVVEFKTGPDNADFRRALAQLLDYGSHLWGLEVDEFEESVAVRYFKSPRCQDARVRSSLRLDDAAQRVWPELSTEQREALRQRLGDQLKTGAFTYVLAAQRFTEQMERGIEYLGETMPGARFFAVEIVRFAGDGYSAFETRVVAGARPRSRSPRSAATLTSELEFLDQVADEEYRDTLERLLDAARGLGFSMEWGSVGCSIRIKTPDRAEPISVAWLFPPGQSGWNGFADLTLGYDPSSARRTPTVQPALDLYVERVRALPGANPQARGNTVTGSLEPADVNRNADELVEILADLSRRVLGGGEGEANA